MSEPERAAAGSKSERDGVLDLRGLKCPLPALFAKRRLLRAKPGETIVVLTDDPLAPVDILHMCTQGGFEHVATEKDGVISIITLRTSQSRGCPVEG